MGKMLKKTESEAIWKTPSASEVRRRRKSLKFPKVSKSTIEKHLAEYEAVLEKMRKLNLPPMDATAAVREQREKN